MTDEWYDQMARSRPPKDEPWYHVLVDGAVHTTYVAQRNLEGDATDDPIRHTELDDYFSGRQDALYARRARAN